MICGIGVDSVEIERFAGWSDYSLKKLSRIFSDEEIEYCLQQKNKISERFAVRFAAREALFKAFSYAFPNYTIPFLTLCARVVICKKNGKPFIVLRTNFSSFAIDLRSYAIHLSWTHARKNATAFVIIEIKNV